MRFLQNLFKPNAEPKWLRTNRETRKAVLMDNRITMGEINKTWREYLRNHPYFSGWRKERERQYVLREDDLICGIELRVSKRRQFMCVLIELGSPEAQPVMPLRDEQFKTTEFGSSQRLSRTAGLANHQRFTDWYCGTIDHFEEDIVEIGTLLDQHAVPFFDRARSEDTRAAAFEFLAPDPMLRLPLILLNDGVSGVRRELITYLIKGEGRLHDENCAWFEKHKILTPEQSEFLRIASMQMETVYQDRAAQLARQLDSDRMS